MQMVRDNEKNVFWIYQRKNELSMRVNMYSAHTPKALMAAGGGQVATRLRKLT
jgi:hypothetical protein